jgi:type I restriction enzyme S subunit
MRSLATKVGRQLSWAGARDHFDTLKQSILAKAFRGELEPQDPNDEPAATLLERIRKARENREAHSLVKGTKKSRSPMANQAHGRPC